MEREFYRVVFTGKHRGYLSESNHDSVESAKACIQDMRPKKENSEYEEYWEGVRAEAKIVKVTEIIEEVQ